MASYDVNTYDKILAGISQEVLIAIMIITLAVMIFFIIVNWKIYKKMKMPGWVSLIPFYNIVVLLKKIKLSLVYFILLLIPIINIFATIKVICGLSKAFGKDVKYTIFTIFFPFLSFPILAFGNASYVYESEPQREEAPAENVDTEYIYCPKCNTRLAQNADSCFICGYKMKNENNISNNNQNIVSTPINNESSNADVTIQPSVDGIKENNSVVDNSSTINNQTVVNNVNQSTGNNSIFESNQEIIKNYNVVDDYNVTPSPLVEKTVVDNSATSVGTNLYQNETSNINNQIGLINNGLDLSIQESSANNNAPSIEEMFNFDYNNIAEANNLINNINNNKLVNNNEDYSNLVNINQGTANNIVNVPGNDSTNIFNNINNINDNNTSLETNNEDNNNVSTDINNIDINHNQASNYNDNMNFASVSPNTEVLDLNFQEQVNSHNNYEKPNTEILNFVTDELKLNNESNAENIANSEISNSFEENNISNTNVASGENSQTEMTLNQSNNDVHISPIKKPTGYRACPICGSKVLPNATNCVICGSKV